MPGLIGYVNEKMLFYKADQSVNYSRLKLLVVYGAHKKINAKIIKSF